MVRTLTGSWSAAELPHRVSQMFVEGVLRAEAAACPTVSIRPGWRMTAVRDTGTGVEVDAEHDGGRTTLRAAYAMGADGGSSPTRKALGYGYVGESGVVRDFMGGRMFAIHFRSAEALRRHPASARLDVLGGEPRPPRLHGDRQRPRPVQLPHPAQARPVGRADHRRARPRRCSRRRSPPRSTSRSSRARPGPPATRWWRRNSSAAASSSAATRCICSRRPAGLATTPRSRTRSISAGSSPPCSRAGAAPALLDTYEIERQAIARRNTAYARGFADSLGLFVPPPELEDEGPAGEAARKLTGDHFNHHARFEFNIPGITFGGRYDGSPIVVPDGTAPPPDAANSYQPTACPGGRAPHLWLADGRSLYDTLGFEFTLLALGAKPADAAPFRAAAAALNMPLAVVPIAGDEARDLYGADLALIRPDQIVAWRGNSAADAAGGAAPRRRTCRLNSIALFQTRAEAYFRITASWRSRIMLAAALASARVAVGQVRYSSSPVS